MARNENAPMQRGETFSFYSDDLATTIDATGGQYLTGKTYEFEDRDWSATGQVKPERSGKYIKCLLCRNTSGAALLPKRAVKFKIDGSTNDLFAGEVSGYATAEGEFCGVADEFLPAAGVPDDGLFWVVIEGPSLVTTAAAGDTNIPAGAAVVPSTDGKIVQRAGASGGASPTAAQVDTAILAAETTLGRTCLAVNGTNTDVMVLVRNSLSLA